MRHQRPSAAADISSGNLDDIDFLLLNQEDDAESIEEAIDEETDFDLEETLDEAEEEIEVRPRRKHRKRGNRRSDSLSRREEKLTSASSARRSKIFGGDKSDTYSSTSFSVTGSNDTADNNTVKIEEKPIMRTAAKPLPDSVKKKIGRHRFRWVRLTTKLVFLGSFTALACWAACGVSLESNFPFWQETIQNDWMQIAGELFGHVQQMVGQVHELIGMITIP